MYGHPTQQVGTEDISQSAGDRKLRLGRWAREKRVVFNFRDGNCLYEQTCRKHHQTPTRFSSANSLPDKQFHARVFALHQSERGLEVNVSRFCRGKSIFKYYPRPRPFVTQRATNARRASALGNTRVRPQPHTPPNVLGDREAFIRTRRGTHSPPSGSRVPSAMLTLARLFPATAVPGVRAERAPLKTVCRATGGGRRNNSRSPKTKPQNVAPGRASTKGTRCFTPSSGNAFKPYSFLPDTVPSRNTAPRSRANAFAPTKRSRRIDDHPVASTDLVSHPFASDTASVSTGKNTVDSSVHATAFDAPFDDAPAPVAPATPVNTPAAPRETKVYDDVDCIIEVRFRPRYPPFAPRGVRSDPNFGPVRFKNVD